MIQEINIYKESANPKNVSVLLQNKTKLLKLKKREDNHYQEWEKVYYNRVYRYLKENNINGLNVKFL